MSRHNYSGDVRFCLKSVSPARNFEDFREAHEENLIVLIVCMERWGAGVETQKNVRGEIGGWGRVPLNETYARR